MRKHNKVLPGRQCRWRVAQTKTNIDKPSRRQGKEQQRRKGIEDEDNNNNSHDKAKRIQRMWRELYTSL